MLLYVTLFCISFFVSRSVRTSVVVHRKKNVFEEIGFEMWPSKSCHPELSHRGYQQTDERERFDLRSISPTTRRLYLSIANGDDIAGEIYLRWFARNRHAYDRATKMVERGCKRENRGWLERRGKSSALSHFRKRTFFAVAIAENREDCVCRQA